ncbi:hypothetical protein TL16_g02590 [Triparma laevis f. inornata]|uniref:Fe2OG dioxygenase domain-containing protein n=1 Tax=Triparma laevis f. inornata TaxID=1714386 RepID=A0A9W6ZWQ6_9STRA|nr:hypothetical protein TL16_g02590 [Triparma laevis f. inornata]
MYPESFNSTLKQCCTKKFFKVTVDKNGSGMKVKDMVNKMDVNWIREGEGREEGLKRLGLSQQTCGCSLCRRERGEIVEMEDLHILLKYFQDDENIEDAIDVCREILRRDVKHVEGLLERARVTGWSDENGEGFVERERLIREAVEITEGKEVRVNEAMRECESYYRDDVFKRVVSGSGGNSGNSLVKSERVCEGVWVYENLLSPLGCVEAVKAAEAYVKFCGGWTTERHYKVPTTDVQVYKCVDILKWLNLELENTIFPILYESFKELIGGRRLRVFDAFFIKYDYGKGQRRLPLHNDQSLISLTIAMNEREGYEGGGTWFMETGEACVTDIGGVTAFRGEMEHRGEGISSGIRYIVAAFLYAEDYPEQQKEEDK